MKETKELASMVCKKEVIAWFSDLKACRRIDFLCALMDCCSSTEWRFLGTYVEALCRRDYDSLREAESSANDVSYLSKLTSATDKRILDKVLTSLALMNSRCTEGARVLFNMLQEHTEAILNGQEQMLCSNEKSHSGTSNRETDEKVVLLAVMAVNHPAFSFSQKLAIRRQLSALLQAVESETALEEEVEEIAESHSVLAADSSKCDLVSPLPKTAHQHIQEKAQSIKEIQIGHIEMDSLQVRQSDKRYECVFKVHWLDSSISTVSKTHAQLFDFQGKLLQLFPNVANEERLIPYIPGEGPGQHIFSCPQARESTDKLIPKEFQEYVRLISALPKTILHCDLMRDFFKEEFSLGGSSENPDRNITAPLAPPMSAATSASSSSETTTAAIPNQEPEPEKPSESLPPAATGQQLDTLGQQPHQGLPVSPPPLANPASPSPHQSPHPLTASVRHLEISHHQNVNLTPLNPFPHVGPAPATGQLPGTTAQLPLPASTIGPTATTGTPPTTESNSVYFQSISSAVSIPTPTDMYTVPNAMGDNLSPVNQPSFDHAMLAQPQCSTQNNSASYATPLPIATIEAFSPQGSSGDHSNGDASPHTAPVTPVSQPSPHQPMICFTSPGIQPLPTTLSKSEVASKVTPEVAPEVQEWLKQQRLHKYEHFFEGLSLKQVIELTDEDIDKWESITEGAKGRFKGHFEQLRQSLLQNGLTASPDPPLPHLVPPPVTFMHPMAPQYYMLPQVGIVPYTIPRVHEYPPRSDNSSSGSAGSRESSDDCERDSENELNAMVSQDVRTHDLRAQCPSQPPKRKGPHGPRHHNRGRHGINKPPIGMPNYTPIVYSPVLKSPVPHQQRNNRHSAATTMPKGPPPADSPIHFAPQHPHLTIINNSSNVVPPSPQHTVIIPPRGEAAIESDGQQGSMPQNVGVQSNIARSQMSPVPPHMHGQTGLGWHHHVQGIIPGGVVTGMQPILDQYATLSPSPQQRMEGPPQHTPPMVQIKASRQPMNNNLYIGEEGVGYRTYLPPAVQVNSPSMSTASSDSSGQPSPGIRPDLNFVGSSPVPSNQNKGGGVYVNRQSGSGSPGPSSHASNENFGATVTTTYVQSANQNAVNVVTTGLGMMHLAYTNPLVLAQSSGPCTCNSNGGGNNGNQTCAVHQGLLPNPPAAAYLPYQSFFQAPYMHSMNLIKGPGTAPRYMNPYHSPSIPNPADMLYGGGHYGGSTGPTPTQQQVYVNQMGGIRPHVPGHHTPGGTDLGGSGKKHPLNCFNCGKQGHKANECRENSMENIMQKCHYRLNYKPESADS